MKKIAVISAAILIAVLFVPGCGKIKVSTFPIDNRAGGGDCADSEITSPYSVCYSFENFTKDNLSFDAAGNGAFTNQENSLEKSYKGIESVKIYCNFKGAFDGSWGGGDVTRKYETATNIDMTGKAITAYVWVPRAMFNSSIPYGMFFYVQGRSPDGSDDWSWYQGPWQNLQMPNPPADGLWNSITARVDDMTHTSGSGASAVTVSMTAATSSKIHAWGIKIGKGNSGSISAADYKGSMYIDSITITGEGPTATMTADMTPTVTETAADTGTETPTATVTIMPTTMDTPTFNNFNSLNTWDVNTAKPSELAFTGPVWDGSTGHGASGCMSVSASFDYTSDAGHFGGDIINVLPSVSNFTGQTFSAWVKVPADIAAAGSYSAVFFIQDNIGGYSSGGLRDLSAAGWVQVLCDASSVTGNADITGIASVGVLVYRSSNLSGPAYDVTGTVFKFDDIMY